jgi:glycosyltransferase involved in cell wall biosynthesis
VAGLAHLAGYEVIRQWQEILLPILIPVLNGFLNRFLVHLWGFRHLGLTNFLIVRPVDLGQTDRAPSVSVVVPARNESGNIRLLLERIPKLGKSMELIFVEGHSRDDTYDTINSEIARHPELDCKLFKQKGKGKADAVQLGFAEARGDILMILDADMTVRPEDLPRFYEAITTNKGEFINGVRMVYPMERQAMRWANMIGNKAFSLAISWTIGQPVRDTLCGTKVLWRNDYRIIAESRKYFGNFDLFGDFDLLFGAAKLNRKIVDMPIRYRDRVYGTTNISRWKHGWLLLRMVWYAAGRLKFV